MARRMISIHALCEEGDVFDVLREHLCDIISIHALCEEGDPHQQRRPQGLRISIHALCEEGDMYSPVVVFMFLRFLSTPSARRATGCLLTYSLRGG